MRFQQYQIGAKDPRPASQIVSALFPGTGLDEPSQAVVGLKTKAPPEARGSSGKFSVFPPNATARAGAAGVRPKGW